MAGHTPWPWKAEMNQKSGVLTILGKRGDGNNRNSDGLGNLFRIDCATWDTADRVMFPDICEEQVANGRLVSAAPDLLASLDPDTLDAIADEIDCPEHSARAHGLRGIAKRQRAAIAKATAA